MPDGRLSSGPAQRVRVWLVGSAAILLVGAGFLFWSAPDPENVAVADERIAAREVSTWEVRLIRVSHEAQVATVLKPKRSVLLFAETEGRVLEVGAEEFDRVEAEQVLARLDPLRAEVAVERAEATLARRESELELARAMLARQRSLAEQAVASEAALEDAESRARVAGAAARESRAGLKEAREELAHKTIRAPFRGALRAFTLDVGEYVHAGQQLGELLDLETARATVSVSDRDIVAVRPGQRVRVRVEAYPTKVFEGRVLRVAAAADPATKKFPVAVELSNAEGRLLPGMVARVALDLGEPVPRRIIPREATIDEFGLRAVFVVEPPNEDGISRLSRRRVGVRPIPFRPDQFEVLSGLELGERIVVGDIRSLRDGERVRVVGGARPAGEPQ